MDPKIYAKLTRPFDESEVKSFSHSGKDFRYIEAPSIIKRLNEVVPMEWNWSVESLPDGCIKGTLTIYDGTNWVTMDGVGAPRHGTHVNRDNITMDATSLWKLGTMEPAEEGRDRIGKLGKMIGDLAPVVDAAKAAESDAFKRAARMFGIGLEMWTDTKPAPQAATATADPSPNLALTDPPEATATVDTDDESDDITSDLSDIIGDIGD